MPTSRPIVTKPHLDQRCHFDVRMDPCCGNKMNSASTLTLHSINKFYFYFYYYTTAVTAAATAAETATTILLQTFIIHVLNNIFPIPLVINYKVSNNNDNNNNYYYLLLLKLLFYYYYYYK